MNMKNYVYFKKYAEEKKQTMAALNVKKGTKMQLALDTKVGQEPQFNMVSTFNKALDESAFLVSIPMLRLTFYIKKASARKRRQRKQTVKSFKIK